MKNSAFHEYLKQKAISKAGGTLGRLWEMLGIQKAIVYRKINRLPWWAFGGCDYKLATRIAETLMDNRNKVLWLMGYNPFVAEGLSVEELTGIFELVLRLVPLIKSGNLARVEEQGGLDRILGMTVKSLQRMSYERLNEAGE